MARPKPFSHVHLRRVAGPDSGSGALSRVRGGDFGPKRRGHGGDSGFEFRRWLTISAERAHSLNPCVVRTRDECTKRSGRSVWTAGHKVFGLAKRSTSDAPRGSGGWHHERDRAMSLARRAEEQNGAAMAFGHARTEQSTQSLGVGLDSRLERGYFLPNQFHPVPFCPIHFYLFGMYDWCIMRRAADPASGVTLRCRPCSVLAQKMERPRRWDAQVPGERCKALARAGIRDLGATVFGRIRLISSHFVSLSHPC